VAAGLEKFHQMTASVCDGVWRGYAHGIKAQGFRFAGDRFF
jgi:hypothetical protein